MPDKAHDGQVYRLRRSGLSLRQIAKKLELSLAEVQRSLARRGADDGAAVARLEKLLRAAAPGVERGDLAAITETRRLINQIGRLQGFAQDRDGVEPPVVTIDQSTLEEYYRRHTPGTPEHARWCAELDAELAAVNYDTVAWCKLSRGDRERLHRRA